MRIIGSFGEGSGFPISQNYIVTNFHVIDGEPSPKIVFPDGTIEIPKDIRAMKEDVIGASKEAFNLISSQRRASINSFEEWSRGVVLPLGRTERVSLG